MSQNLLILSGTEAFLRRRQLNAVVQTAHKDEWAVSHVDGSDRNAVAEALSEPAFFTTGSSLVVVDNAAKIDPALVDAHVKNKQSSTMLLLHHEGKPKAGSAFAKLAKKYAKRHRSFETPPLYKQEGEAVKFCVEEAKVRGKELEPRLAKALVVAAGTDLGVLYYEIFKVCTLADVEQLDSITLSVLRDGMAEMSEASAFQLLEGLEQKNIKRVCSALDRIKKTHSGDPTMKLCGFLWKFTTQWLAAADLIRQGVSDQESADLMGVSIWYYRNKIFPAAKTWGLGNLKKLVRGLAGAERSVKSGAVNPWNLFSSNLLSLFQ